MIGFLHSCKWDFPLALSLWVVALIFLPHCKDPSLQNRKMIEIMTTVLCKGKKNKHLGEQDKNIYFMELANKDKWLEIVTHLGGEMAL